MNSIYNQVNENLHWILPVSIHYQPRCGNCIVLVFLFCTLRCFFFLFLLRSPSPNILNILKNQKSIFLHFYPKFRSSILIECKAKFIEKKISIEFNFCFKFQIYFPSDRGRVKFQTKFVSHIFLSFFFFLSGEKKHSTKSSNVTVTRERRTGKELKKKKKKKK